MRAARRDVTGYYRYSIGWMCGKAITFVVDTIGFIESF
jgi:hypothetical protein